MEKLNYCLQNVSRLSQDAAPVSDVMVYELYIYIHPVSRREICFLDAFPMIVFTHTQEAN